MMMRRFRFHRVVALAGWALILAVAFGAVNGFAAERVSLVVLGTTDLHGHINPIDHYTNQPAQHGLAKVATLVRQIRREQPNVILLDCGDTIQGTPLVYVHNRRNNAPPDPMMLCMSALGYDAMAIGNHEFNFGLTVLEKARREAAFPWLSANTYRAGTEEPAFVPYLIKEVAGVRMGVLGLTTPGVPAWEDPQNFEGLEFRETMNEARKWVAMLRERERVDVVVVAMHMGMERDPSSSTAMAGQLPGENAALAIAESVPGIDLILMGHTHRNVPAHEHNGVLLTQAGRWGGYLARADLEVEREAPSDRWRIGRKTARTIAVGETVTPDPEVLQLAEPYERETAAWLDQVIGECAVELTARESRLRDTAIIDLIHRVQMEAGNADVSMAASFSLSARLPTGPVTVRDIAGLYVYENTLVVIEVTGAQLKAALEHSAKYFRTYEAGKRPAELVDPLVPGYNFDMAEGVSYDLDVSRPVGDRIVNLRFRGEPLDLDRKLRLAINNYRLNGGGGYTMYQGAPVLYRSSTEIRELLIDWIERHRHVPTEPSHNWRLLPDSHP